MMLLVPLGPMVLKPTSAWTICKNPGDSSGMFLHAMTVIDSAF